METATIFLYNPRLVYLEIVVYAPSKPLTAAFKLIYIYRYIGG